MHILSVFLVFSCPLAWVREGLPECACLFGLTRSRLVVCLVSVLAVVVAVVVAVVGWLVGWLLTVVALCVK